MKLDPISIAIGFLAGILTTLLAGWIRGPVWRTGRRVAKRTGRMYRWLSAGIEGRYRVEMVKYAQSHHLGAGAAPLDAIFVPSRLIHPPEQPQPEINKVLPASTLTYLWPKLAAQIAIPAPKSIALSQVISLSRRIVLLGPAGSGKSSTLAFIALATARRDPGFETERLPIYAHLSELDIWNKNKEAILKTPQAPLLKAIQKRAGTLTSDTVPSLLSRALNENAALLLLDGWDELSPSEREVCTLWLSQFITIFPGNQYVLTGPFDGYGALIELGFVPLQLQSWRLPEAEQLMRRWSEITGQSLSQVRNGDQLGTGDFNPLDFWRPGLTALDTTLALWLTLSGETLDRYPAHRYGAALHRLLTPFSKGEASNLTDIAERVLRIIAWELAERKSRFFSANRLGGVIREVLGQQDHVDGLTAKDCQNILENQCGLLVPWSKDRLTFSSPAFQNYFLATEFGKRFDQVDMSPYLCSEWMEALSSFADLASVISELVEDTSGIRQDSLFLAAAWAANTDDYGERNKVLVRLARMIVNQNVPLPLRQRAVAALVNIQDKGVGYLLRQAMGTPDPLLQICVAPGLGALATELPGRRGDQRSMDTLIQALGSSSEAVQVATIHALAATQAKTALNAIVSVLLGGKPPEQQAAAEALATMGENGVKVLREALEEKEALIRRAALFGLDRVDEPWVTETLKIIQREDGEWFVRSTAEELLIRREKREQSGAARPVKSEDLAWLVNWSAERGRGVPAGPKAEAVLDRVLHTAEEPTVRAAAARSMGDIYRLDSLFSVVTALEDSNSIVRDAAYYAYVTLSRAWDHPDPPPTP